MYKNIESLCCAPETSIILYVNDNLKNQKEYWDNTLFLNYIYTEEICPFAKIKICNFNCSNDYDFLN